MLANYLIGLREGLEAGLVVGILVAYLVRTGNRDRLGPLWAGVVLAVVVSLAGGAVLTFTSRSMSFKAQETFAGVMSALAVGFVTWMIFWMRRTARRLKGELHTKLDSALLLGGWALALTAFIAVAREGLETALFIWTAVRATGSSVSPVAGAVLGLATAVALGYLFYKGSVKIDLARFFTFTGAALVIVAAGVLAYAAHELQEAGYLTMGGLGTVVVDASRSLPPSTWYGSLFKGLFSISVAPTRLELGVWLAYLVPVLFLFLHGGARRTAPAGPAPGAAARASCASSPSKGDAASS